MVLEKTLESPLDSKEIKPVNPKGNQPWIFIGRTNAEAEAPVLWPPDAKSWLIGKAPDAGKDWGQEEKGVTEDTMVGWLDGISSMDMSLSKLQEIVRTEKPGVLQSMGWQRIRHKLQLNNNLLGEKKKKKRLRKTNKRISQLTWLRRRRTETQISAEWHKVHSVNH